MNCAIIGAGQLGSRHLQGLLTFSAQKLNIFVVDPSNESLAVAKQRAAEVDHQHHITFENVIIQLPQHLDFVVVATNSMVRFEVIKALLEHSTVVNLILEKVLFPEIKQYDLALELIQKNQVTCWVNHPRRMYEDYKDLKTYIDPIKTYSFQLLGAAWGLACNGLHFVDLFEYLTESSLTSVSCQLLERNPIESKRGGYIEFEGTISGIIGDKHSFSISSLSGDNVVAPSMSIMTDDLRLFIQESGTPCIYIFAKEKAFALETKSFNVKFQSQLTGKLFEQIYNLGTCDLPSLEQATHTHKIFIKAILDHWNSVTDAKNEILPIT